jgi:hypothetical protein
LRDKNLTGYYGYQGFGYGYDPWYWGYGPFWPVNNIYVDYPDIPYNYEDLMQKEIDADNLVNTIQDQIATQLIKQEGIPEEQEAEQEVKEEKVEKKEDKKKETFQSIEQENKQCNKNNILVILVVVLIIYLLVNLPLSDAEKGFSL